jgi:hypothetical protein
MDMTQSAALIRVEQLIKTTAAGLTPRPNLELVPYSVAPHPCIDHEAEVPGRQISINRQYWLRDVPATANMAIARQVMDHWKQEGHAVTSTGGFDVGHPSVGGMSRPDGFILALVWAEGDHLYLAATSPCVWPDGTPQP